MDRFLGVRDHNGVFLPIAKVALHRYAIKLAAATLNTITIPISSDGNVNTGNPKMVLITSDCEVWVKFGAAVAVPGANVVDGTAPVLIPANGSRILDVPVGTQLSFISTAGGLAVCEWYE